MFNFTTSTVVAYEDTPVDVRVASGIAQSSADRLEAESQQKLRFRLTLVSGNSSLFEVPPSINTSTGFLSCRPALNAYGRTVWSIVLIDDGGAEKRGHTRGQNVSIVRQLAVEVVSVNDAPSFSHKPNITLLANDYVSSSFWEPRVVYDWKAGPPDEQATQSLTFDVRTDPYLPPSLWVSRPYVAANGSLFVQIASSMVFSTTLTVVLRDNGGTAYGGMDTFARNITLYFVARPEPVTNLAILQKVDKRLDILWSHVDVGRPISTPGRTQHFILDLVKDCSAVTSPAEIAICPLFKRTQTVPISQCSIATSLCNTNFTELENAVRYVLSIAAQNSAGPSISRRLGAVTLRPPSAPPWLNVTQLGTRNFTMSILRLDWDK